MSVRSVPVLRESPLAAFALCRSAGCFVLVLVFPLPLRSGLWLQLGLLWLRISDHRWLVCFELNSSSTKSERGHQVAVACVPETVSQRVPTHGHSSASSSFRMSSLYWRTICHEGLIESLPSRHSILSEMCSATFPEQSGYLALHIFNASSCGPHVAFLRTSRHWRLANSSGSADSLCNL